MVNNILRKYGKAPYTVALIHGGPAASGGMEPICRELSSSFGILEPLQTKNAIEGLVEELRTDIEENAKGPVALVGHSWGAWLSVIFTHASPESVSKLILVGSGPFEEKYAKGLMDFRMGRLGDKERSELKKINSELTKAKGRERDRLMMSFGRIMSKADSFELMDHEEPEISFNYGSHVSVWDEASKMRRDGKLLAMASGISCPVVAIHGDHDPHAADGVRLPLSRAVKDFKFYLLERCGHEPWYEKYAKSVFYEILNKELKA